MRVLLIKMSSLGDVFHTFPALTDAAQAVPGLKVDWIVEEGFAEMASWHPAVEQVFPIGLRRWRRSWLAQSSKKERHDFVSTLLAQQERNGPYDLVLDAQGLLKSAWVARWVKKCLSRATVGHKRALLHGLSYRSAREPLASLVYDSAHKVKKGRHAIYRLRDLFAAALGYPVPNHSEFTYGLNVSKFSAPPLTAPYIVFLHGTNWDTKLWPEPYWVELARLKISEGLNVVLPFGNIEEEERAKRIQAAVPEAQILPRMGLNELASWLKHAQGVVGVDTGLSHVVAGLEVPSVAIYGSTDPQLTGVLGPKVKVLQAKFACSPCLERQCRFKDQPYPPCYQSVPPDRVNSALLEMMGGQRIPSTSFEDD